MRTSISKLAAGNRRQTAFTLMEVVIAASITFVAMVGVFGCMTMGLSVTELSAQNLRATQIMVDKMEGLRLYNWTQINDPTFLQSGFTNWFYETNNIGETNATGNGVQYTGSVVVASWPFTNAYSANMRQVTVNIGWVSGSVTRSRSMITYVGNSGLQNYVYYY